MARAMRQPVFPLVATILCLGALGALASSASAYSYSSWRCAGSGGIKVTKAITDWNYSNLVMPARNITRAPSYCSTSRNQRIVVEYRLLFLSRYYPYDYQVQAHPIVERIVGPGGYLPISEAAWGGSFGSSVELSPFTNYRTEVRVWWEWPSGRGDYGYKSYYSNSNSDYTCATVSTINGDAYCRVSAGAVMQAPGIWNQIPSA
jgi:hypothetical protein